MRECWLFAAVLAVSLIGSSHVCAQTDDIQRKVEAKLMVARLMQGIRIGETLQEMAIATLEWHVEQAQEAAAFISRLVRRTRIGTP